jgi:hypothetical protein
MHSHCPGKIARVIGSQCGGLGVPEREWLVIQPEITAENSIALRTNWLANR